MKIEAFRNGKSWDEIDSNPVQVCKSFTGWMRSVYLLFGTTHRFLFFPLLLLSYCGFLLEKKLNRDMAF